MNLKLAENIQLLHALSIMQQVEPDAARKARMVAAQKELLDVVLPQIERHAGNVKLEASP